MRYFQKIPEAQKQERMTTSFRGYNHNEIISDGELYDTRNLTADQYPTMSLRAKRGTTSYQQSNKLEGIYGNEKLTVISGTTVTYDGQTVTGITVSAADGMQPKKIVGFGAYVCIWPDKVYFNTTNIKDCGSMERLWYGHDEALDEITAQICRADGTDYDLTDITISDTAPASPDDGDLWIDQSGEADVLRQYSDSSEEWVEVPTVYVKLGATGIGTGLSMYDAVNIDNLTYSGTAPSDRVKAQLSELNGSHIVYDCGDDYVIVVGMLSAAVKLKTSLRVDRTVPNLDYIVESNNRLWGCFYGMDINQELWEGWGKAVDIKMCQADGTAYSEVAFSNGYPPSNPSVGEIWVTKDSKRNFHTLIYVDLGNDAYAWRDVQTYIKVSATGIGKNVLAGRTVMINNLQYTGTPASAANEELGLQISKVTANPHKVYKSTDNYIVIDGIISKEITNCGGDDTDEPHNRVTVFYTAEAGEYPFLNEIRCSKLGDFRNWNTYMGLSTDSYTASVGTDGPFTGAVTQMGYPIFFKENAIHRVYGNTPDSFQVTATMCRGLQEGSWRSAAVVNELIYYKSRTDIMVYDGNMPRSVSEQLGKKLYSDARAGAVNGKYYISMKDEADGKYYQFVYDTKLGIWYKEDQLKALMYATVKDELYMIDEANNALITVYGSQGTLESSMDWTAVFGISGIEYTPNKYGNMVRGDSRGYRYLSRFDIRMYLEEGSKMDMYIEYNSDGSWHHQGEITGRNTKSFVIPVIPYRCDHLRVKLTGNGDFRIYSVSRILEVGSDG